MIRPTHMAKAIGDFCSTLLGRRDPIVALSPNGHTILAGWSHAPEEAAIAFAQKERNQEKDHPRASLFCYAGPHAGDTIFLSGKIQTVGTAASDDIVLTAEGVRTDQSFRFLLNGHTRLVADTGHSFKLNGVTEQQATLFDFDELELLGNRFLVLEMGENL